jgi:hypothetical protein
MLYVAELRRRFLLGLCCVFTISSCGPRASSQVSLRIDDPLKSQTTRLAEANSFGVSELDSSLCYAIHVTGPDLFLHRQDESQICANDLSPHGLGVVEGMFSFGDAIDFEVKVGSERRFDLIGFRKTVRTDLLSSGETADPAPTNCPSDLRALWSSENQEYQVYSGGTRLKMQTIFLATGTSVVQPGSNTITLSLLRDTTGSIGKEYVSRCSNAVQAPSSFSYTTPVANYNVGSPILANTPIGVGSAIDSFSVTPALPSGLSLNSVTGIIAGTPTTVQASQTYTVTATNSSGSASTTLSILVLPSLPTVTTIANGINSAGSGGNFVVDSAGNIFFVEPNNYLIKKRAAADGTVTAFAGGSNGFSDGIGLAATFLQPTHLTIDSSDNVYVADAFKIRKITPTAVVTTVGQMGASGLQHYVAAGSGGEVFFVFDDYANTTHTVQKMDSAGNVTPVAGTSSPGDTLGPVASAQFNTPRGLAVDSFGNIFVADAGNRKIKKISGGVVTLFAGSGTNAIVDGSGAGASFSFDYPSPNKVVNMAIDANNNLYVGDMMSSSPNHYTVRKITPTGVVTTVCGNTGNPAGACGTTAIISTFGLAVDAFGSIFTLNGSSILKISF